MRITLAQKELLDSFIGDDGSSFEFIRDYPDFSKDTKILYLRKAISEYGHIFLNSLDELYDFSASGNAKKDRLDFIFQLKLINDFCYNNELQCSDNPDAPLFKKTHVHYFEKLGELISADIRDYVKKTVAGRILDLTNSKTEKELHTETFATDLNNNSQWRQLLALPRSQRKLKTKEDFIYSLSEMISAMEDISTSSTRENALFKKINNYSILIISRSFCAATYCPEAFKIKEALNFFSIMHKKIDTCIKQLRQFSENARNNFYEISADTQNEVTSYLNNQCDIYEMLNNIKRAMPTAKEEEKLRCITLFIGAGFDFVDCLFFSEAMAKNKLHTAIKTHDDFLRVSKALPPSENDKLLSFFVKTAVSHFFHYEKTQKDEFWHGKSQDEKSLTSIIDHALNKNRGVPFFGHSGHRAKKVLETLGVNFSTLDQRKTDEDRVTYVAITVCAQASALQRASYQAMAHQ